VPYDLSAVVAFGSGTGSGSWRVKVALVTTTGQVSGDGCAAWAMAVKDAVIKTVQTATTRKGVGKRMA
jgi:hypothetical protein